MGSERPVAESVFLQTENFQGDFTIALLRHLIHRLSDEKRYGLGCNRSLH